MTPSEYRGPSWLAFLHEMRTMSPSQNLYRIYYELSRRLGLHKKRYRAEVISDSELYEELSGRFKDGQGLLDHLRSRDNVRFFICHRDREATSVVLNERFGHNRARCIELADEICRHHFDLMGTVTEFDGDINWHQLLGTDQSWPQGHWSTISIRNPTAIGEIKTTWELNRHQFWLHLGRAYWYTGDEKYAREWASQLRSWLDQNPPEMGVNWLSNLELAIRAVSWIWSLEMFLGDVLDRLQWPGQFRGGDAEALAEAMDQIAGRIDEFRDKRQAIHEAIRQDHSWAAVAERPEQLFVGLVGTAPGEQQ